MASIIQRTLVHAVRRYSQISYQLKPKTFLPKLSNYNVKFYESTGKLRRIATWMIQHGVRGVGKDPKDEVKPSESNDKTVVEYAENSMEYYYMADFENMSKCQIVLYLTQYFSEERGSLKKELKFATDCIQKMRVVLDLRHEAETTFTKFWVQTPQVTTWRRDIKSVILMYSKNCPEEIQEIIESFKDTDETTPHSELNPKLLPASKLKLSVLFDDMFLKWTYVLLHSGDEHVVALREKLSVPDLIRCASDLAYILITVHDATHKEFPKSSFGLGPLTIQMISSTLREEYQIKEKSIQNILTVLRMEEF